MKNHIPLYIISLIIFIFSCYKDEVITDSSSLVDIEHPENKVSGDVVGILEDEDGNPIDNFLVKVNSKDETTKKANFFISRIDAIDQSINKLNIKTSSGDFDFNMLLLDSEVNYVHKNIIKYPSVLKFFNQSQMNFPLGLKFNIEMDSMAFIYQSIPYSGEVKVNWFIPDLENPSHVATIPGNHIALDEYNHQVWLSYDNVVYLDFRTDNGENLTTDKDKISLSLTENLKSDQSFWKFDQKLQKWIRLNNNSLNKKSISISEGGFYCIGKTYQYNLCGGKLISDSGNLINLAVDIIQGGQFIDRVYTTNTGRWLANLPINEEYSLHITNTDNSLTEMNFKTNALQTLVEPLKVNSVQMNLIALEDTPFDCSGSPLKEFFIELNSDQGNQIFFIKDPKNYNLIWSKSWHIKEFQSINADLSQNSQILKPEDENKIINLNTVYCCNEFKDGFLKLTIEGKTKTFIAIDCYKNEDRTEIVVYDDKNLESEILFSFKGLDAKTYDNNLINVDFDNVHIDNKIYEFQCLYEPSGCGFKTFTISHVGKIKGSWIKGFFKGDFWVKTLNTSEVSYLHISGEFLAPRNFN